MPLSPIISPEIFALRPDFTALSLVVTGAANRPSNAISAALLADAIEHLDAPWAEAHLEAWRDAYRAFGSKPSRFPSSAEALRKRVLRDGTLRPTNAVVDIYNAVSLRFAVPVGGEDARSYLSNPTLCRAKGDEPFATMSEGAPKTETAEVGEVIWCDAAGVTCRRWNWRQGPRTQLTEATTDMWFVLERLDPMPIEVLIEAGQAIARGLMQIAPTAKINAALFDSAQPTGKAIEVDFHIALSKSGA